MKFFLDTAEIAVISEFNERGLIDGVTTNPSLIAKSGRNILEVTEEIADLVDGPVSAEVTAADYETMMKEGRKLAAIAPNIAVKVPLTVDGLRTCRSLAERGIMVNVTLCFSASQAILAAKSGAMFISPFVGRLDDRGEDGMQLIADIVDAFDNYPEWDTEVLVASVRSNAHVERAAVLGADVVTLPPKVLEGMYSHELTDKGLAAFEADWAATGQSIL